MNLVSPFPLIALPVVLLNHTHGWIEFNAGKDTVPRVAAAFCGSTDAAAFDPSSYLPEPDSTSLQMTTEWLWFGGMSLSRWLNSQRRVKKKKLASGQGIGMGP